jgi:hypothetical protein
MHCFDPRKIRESLRIRRKAIRARPQAYEDARRLSAAIGPAAVGRDYVDSSEALNHHVVAECFAAKAYRREDFKAARDGALAGFSEFEGASR